MYSDKGFDDDNRLGHKIGKDENDVIPYILKLEREWLLQRAQLKVKNLHCYHDMFSHVVSAHEEFG